MPLSPSETNLIVQALAALASALAPDSQISHPASQQSIREAYLTEQALALAGKLTDADQITID